MRCLAGREDHLSWQRLKSSRIGRKSTWPVGELGEVGDRRLEVVDEALRARPGDSSARVWRIHGKPGLDRGRRLADARDHLERPRARGRERRRSGCRAPGSPPRAPAAARGSSRSGSSSSAASAPIVMLKLVMRSLSCPRCDGEGREDLLLAADQLRQVVRLACRAGAWLTIAPPRSDVRRSTGASRSATCRRSRPSCQASWSASSPGSGSAVDRVAVAHQQLLEVLARVGLERAEHLVDLHRRRGLRSRDRVDRCRRRARPACPAGRRRRGCPRRRCAGGP